MCLTSQFHRESAFTYRLLIIWTILPGKLPFPAFSSHSCAIPVVLDFTGLVRSFGQLESLQYSVLRMLRSGEAQARRTLSHVRAHAIHLKTSPCKTSTVRKLAAPAPVLLFSPSRHARAEKLRVLFALIPPPFFLPFFFSSVIPAQGRVIYYSLPRRTRTTALSSLQMTKVWQLAGMGSRRD